MFDLPWEKKSLEITEKVVSALKEQGVSKQELAARLGVTPQYVSKIVHGGENLTLETISKLEAALGISLGGRTRTFSRYASSRSDASFHKYSQGDADPRLSVRKALIFENNIPSGCVETMIMYSTQTVPSPDSDILAVTAKAQYQCTGRICVDVELTMEFSVPGLASSVRTSPEGGLEVEDGLCEEILPRALDISRGFISALVCRTPLLNFPLPSFTPEWLKSRNTFKPI